MEEVNSGINSLLLSEHYTMNRGWLCDQEIRRKFDLKDVFGEFSLNTVIEINVFFFSFVIYNLNNESH